MKTYILMISSRFMRGHPRAGQATEFKRKLLTGALTGDAKLHTIRGNAEYWRKVAIEVNAGRGVLSLREWSGKPYKSKQREITKCRQMGVEDVEIIRRNMPASIGGLYLSLAVENISANHLIVAKNDGLSPEDFWHWFNKPFTGCIIHFSRLRYDN